MEIYSLFFSLTLTILFAGIHSATLTVKNNCQDTIWPATLTGGTDAAQLSNTGFELASQASFSLDVPASWTGRIWARTQCSSDHSGRFTCATADCGSGQVTCNGMGGAPPASLSEFTLASEGGQDYYDLSLVDGFNLPVSITPQGGSGPTCTTTGCAANVNAVCPSELALTGSDESIIGCKSACVVFNQPQYCCTGEYNSADTCKPTNYSMIFKNQCPQAYSYAYDDGSSTFSCTGGPNYLITFCP
ncbi:hypothetical protein SLEP1_g42815 [Rubroshorea leprosula]|uniref:Thaumatin-like protein n=1 Tax=Rubroshorea leprosula TaxID=152421 RepID=A0AAV5LBK8_9ROSI|nr:hypothetical protein SLEP1_g42815 [Rubroshorea leprosula]